MAIPNPTVKFTYEDYLNAPEDKRYELLDGELVPIPTPGERHQSISILLGSKLVQFAYENSLGRVYHAPFDVVLSDVDVIQPDLLFVSNERCHIITPANIQGAPDLVVEILSLSTAERETFKRALYANHGVNEYWMVDPTAKDITVLLLGERGYEVVDTYGEGATLTSPTLQGFRVHIATYFEGVTMPRVSGIQGPYRFFFYSFDCHEPRHVHVRREKRTCKYWLEPIALCKNYGFSS